MGGAQAQSEFLLYANYKYAFIALVIALYLNLWTSITKIFRSRSQKIMLIIILIASLLAWLLSLIPIVDHNDINEVALSRYIPHLYHIETPQIKERIIQYAPYNNIELYLARSKDQPSASSPILLCKEHSITYEDLDSILIAFCDRTPYRSGANLYIDKNIKMKDVLFLEKHLANTGLTHARYMASTTGANNIYTDLSLPILLRDKTQSPFLHQREKVEKEVSQTDLTFENNRIFINGIPILTSTLTTLLKTQPPNKETIINLHIDPEMSYDLYLRTLATTRQVIADIKNELSLNKYHKEYEWLNIKQRNTLRSITPLKMHIISD